MDSRTVLRASACLSTFWLTLLSSPAFCQKTDTTVYTPPDYTTMAPPPAGQTYVDPVFGTTIKRVTNARNQTNADAGGVLTFITGEYSTMSPFNNDNSRLLLICQSYFALWDGSGHFIRNLPFEINGSSEPRWSRKANNILYYVHGNQLKQYNTDTDVMSVVHTFTEYTSITGKGESDICFDGDHFVFAGDNRYVFVYEISTGQTGNAFDTGGRGFDSIYITPDDNVTITWLQSGSSRYNGIELFDRQMNFRRQLSTYGCHMDVTRDTNGDEVLITTSAADPAPKCENAVMKVRLSDGQATCLAPLDWSLAVHISAPDKSGWCFVETYAPSDPVAPPGWTTYTDEILQIKLDGSEVRRLAHHRSRPYNSYTYQPRVSVSRDGSVLVYNSNFGLQGSQGYPTEYSDVYMINVPGTPGSTSSTSTGGSTPPTTSTGGSGSTSGTATQTKTHEETDAAVAYTGAWYVNNNAGHSGGAAKLSMDTGARATFTFTGTAVCWTAYQDEWSGIAKVYLDGQLSKTVDTYASPAKFKSVVYSASGLASGSHTITIEATGTHNSSSGGSWVWIDSFAVDAAASGTTPTTGTTDGTATTITVQDSSSAMTYSGYWYTHTSAGHSGGTARLAMDSGQTAKLTFNGTSVTWTGYRDEWSGIARVYIDGKLSATVDTYQTPSAFKSKLFSASGLASGTHTLTIEVTGTRNAASGGSWVWIDTIEVAGTGTYVAMNTESQSLDNSGSIAGNGVSSMIARASGGALAGMGFGEWSITGRAIPDTLDLNADSPVCEIAASSGSRRGISAGN